MPFSKKVIRLIKAIHRGMVATYGLIAKLADNPHGSSEVGWVLHSSTRSQKLRWQRVVKARGRLSFTPGSPTCLLQRKLLEREGVFLTHERVDLKKYLWEKPLKISAA